MIRVLVSAKSAITRAGLEAVIRADGRFELVEEPISDLTYALRKHAPDVILLDGVPPGFRNASHLVEGGPPAFVACIDHLDRAEIRRLLQSGVRAVIQSESSPSEITGALEAAAAGLAVVSPEILEVLLPAVADTLGDEELSAVEPLTPRETEILSLLAEGAGNKEIASRLHISEHTVKFHVSSILAKLGAGTRTEAVTRGYRQGLILM